MSKRSAQRRVGRSTRPPLGAAPADRQRLKQQKANAVSTYAHWMAGAKCVSFEAMVKSARASTEIAAFVAPAEIASAALALRAQPEATAHTFTARTKGGFGKRSVPIDVPRDRLLAIALALADAADDDDAGHRFWHLEYPDCKKPCDDCAESRAAHETSVLVAHAAFVSRWAARLHAATEEIEELISEHKRLPRPRLR